LKLNNMSHYIMELLEKVFTRILNKFFKKPVKVDVPVSFSTQIK